MKKENTKIIIFDWGGVVESHKMENIIALLQE